MKSCKVNYEIVTHDNKYEELQQTYGKSPASLLVLFVFRQGSQFL